MQEDMTTTIKPVLKYPGAKWRLAPWIVQYLPAHITYLEPYCGSAAVFFTKAPASYEILNDRFGSIVNLFRVLREQGPELARLIDFTPWAREEYAHCEEQFSGTGSNLEDAYRFLIRCWQAHGTRFNHASGWRNRGATNADATTTKVWRRLPDRLLAVIDRLKCAEIENRPALEVIVRYQTPACCIYADPPYPLSTRNGAYYEYEMTEDDHADLLEVLDRHPGPVLLSSYEHPLYTEQLGAHWTKLTTPAVTEHGQHRTEVLWLNPRAARDTHQLPLPLFGKGA